MKRVVVTAAADRDTENIIAYLTSEAGGSVAAEYIASFENLYDRLAQFPGSGSPHPAFGSDIRIGLVDPYIVIYQYADNSDTVTIVRIIHTRRRITRRFIAESSAQRG